MKDVPSAAAAAGAGASTTSHGGNDGHGDALLPHGPWEDSYRLPAQALPLHYLLTLRPDLPAGTFTGDVEIAVDVKEPVPYLAVHVKRLEVLATSVRREAEGEGEEGGRAVALRGAFAYPPFELWVMQPQDEGGFAPARYSLHFAFRGNLTGKIVGFYRSLYLDKASQRQRVIATSKFQPTYARQAFPCFDEPSFKSRFSVRLVRPSGDGYIALSNMNVEREVKDEPSSGLTTVYFKESVPMVTYLACFIVCDFQNLPPLTVNPGNIPFTVYSQPLQVNKTQYALETGAGITQFYINYFDIKYPLPKLDMIAIPDFVSGAMEHWGLITFRETNLLFDPHESSAVNQQRVATVIGHELAHMWFGNLMTLKWWDDLWLNEGFATYIEYRGVNYRHPEWKMMEQFIISDLQPVLVLDAALSSHPIVQTVSHPDEITELFDTISYNKGASVIRMLDNFMGEENFRKGICNFLKRFEFKNAVTQDLWDALQEILDQQNNNGINITHVMDTWTRQKGFPVITVEVDETGNRVLSQKRFLSDPEANSSDTSPFGFRWEVPITYISSANREKNCTWLHSQDTKLTISVPNAEWIKFNHQQVGYYRVNYSEKEWQNFSAVLKGNVAALDSADRANLLDDAFSLADAGLLRYNIALDGTQYLRQETDYIPWHVAAGKLKRLLRMLQGTLVYSDLRKYVQSLILDTYKSVSWNVSETDSHLWRLLRMKILDLGCASGLEECLTEANEMFTRWLENPEKRPHPDVRALVYSYGIKKGGSEKSWDLMWNLFLKEENAQEKVKLMEGLASATEPWLLQRYIELSKNESNVRSQDFFTVIAFISYNPIGNPVAWDFLRSEWEYLVDRFTLNDRYLGRMIPTITKSFNSQLKKEEMITFFDRYPEAGAGKTARSQSLETVSNNIHWIQTYANSIGSWLVQQTRGQ